MGSKKSRGCTRVYAGVCNMGGLAPLNQSIHPTKTAAVGPLSLHFVPQGHGGGYGPRPHMWAQTPYFLTWAQGPRVGPISIFFLILGQAPHVGPSPTFFIWAQAPHVGQASYFLIGSQAPNVGPGPACRHRPCILVHRVPGPNVSPAPYF